jgi:hypothetical protein
MLERNFQYWMDQAISYPTDKLTDFQPAAKPTCSQPTDASADRTLLKTQGT